MKDSQFNLAVLLERGLGTEVNKADAWFWYSIAAQQDAHRNTCDSRSSCPYGECAGP